MMLPPLKRLSRPQVQIILDQKRVFMRAQELTGVPWEAVAAIWYRESFSVTPPKTPGGPFQFDPIPEVSTMQMLLDNYTNLKIGSAKQQLINEGVNNFAAGAVFAACWLRHSCKPKITVASSDQDLKDAFYGYNGRNYGGIDKSPYVMNDWDEAHRDMRIRGTIPDGHGGRKWIDAIDQRPGAFTVYKQLKSVC